MTTYSGVPGTGSPGRFILGGGGIGAPPIPPTPPTPQPPPPITRGDILGVNVTSFSPYRVLIGSLSGQPIEELDAAKNLQYSYILNSPGAVSLVLPLRHPKSTPSLIIPGARTILVYRNETLVWAGPLWSVTATVDGVTLSGAGWLDILRRRYVDWTTSFTNSEQFDIAWDVMSRMQTDANEGFARGVIPPSGITRQWSFTASDRKLVYDAINEIATMDKGFDFEILPNKTWMTYYPFKGIDTGIVFSLEKNISGISWEIDASNLATEVTSTGAGTDNNSILISVKSDPIAVAQYGLRQSVTSYPDVTRQSTLDGHAQADLNMLKVPTDVPQFQIVVSDPPFGSYRTGDTVTVQADLGYLQINKDYRITSITVAVSDDGIDNVGLFFDQVQNTS